jgi:hypothetical protein
MIFELHEISDYIFDGSTFGWEFSITELLRQFIFNRFLCLVFGLRL